MPYVKQERREYLDQDYPAVTAGDLNYLITKQVAGFLNGEVDYHGINMVIGALECAKLELYRRIASPYEDIKIEENGDVY